MRRQKHRVGVRFSNISIEPCMSLMDALAGEFADLPANITEGNLQARCRVVLMPFPRKKSVGADDWQQKRVSCGVFHLVRRHGRWI